MFDPHDYFDIRHHRAVCPVHGKRNRNLEIKRHKSEPKWVFNCYSHNCSLKEIAMAAGFNPADVYDNDRDPDWRPTVTASSVGGLTNLIAYAKTKRNIATISDRVEDTFGPNQCDNLRMVNQETNERIGHLCDRKRCVHCGPRKSMTIQLQMEGTFGRYAYISTFDNREDLDRCIARIKKTTQRDGQEHPYQSVGDSTLGYILVSDIPTASEHRLGTLRDWTQRILDRYINGAQRIRRSYSLGRVSLVPHRRKRATGDKPSIWQVMTRRWALVRAVEDDNWDDMRDEIDYRDDNVYDSPPDWVDPA